MHARVDGRYAGRSTNGKPERTHASIATNLRGLVVTHAAGQLKSRCLWARAFTTFNRKYRAINSRTAPHNRRHASSDTDIRALPVTDDTIARINVCALTSERCGPSATKVEPGRGKIDRTGSATRGCVNFKLAGPLNKSSDFTRLRTECRLAPVDLPLPRERSLDRHRLLLTRSPFRLAVPLGRLRFRDPSRPAEAGFASTLSHLHSLPPTML